MGSFLDLVANTLQGRTGSSRLHRLLAGTGRLLRSPERLREGITHRGAPPLGVDYPGDFTGRPDLRWAPRGDQRPDPGEVVWTRVPFEEDHRQGKDRPVLLVGRDGPWLLGLPLTSKDHDRDEAQEAAQGRFWMDIGPGPWDPRGRASEARLDRIVRVDPRRVRRVSAALDRELFDRVARGVLEHRGR